jgi:hypothetical protein
VFKSRRPHFTPLSRWPKVFRNQNFLILTALIRIMEPRSGLDPRFRMVARTQDLAEANSIADQHAMQGFEVRIVKKAQGNLALYEVWIAKAPQILS